ncbi:hypothetical protein IWW55_001172 [Coemansia sp. RSA 2706]|nr:hypothetical protein LPJ63_002983 [Coemansia sp. RSA 2711]KAJ1846104.1 hypothetical protein LPJ70_002200 [Coemansia sp. RSA 2708]KAJ2307027.1 hypothetical protein IWW55_001172 [Coemansia sp. RSA 2706]KAJ2312842.1 hypothetical protein IWW54_001854 [Coemansia sp. RSA 2705]KAJ2318837.1 hypothetical protein IWW51_005017 [Coemansia sp. RSA 2702]KAJ2320616.1 hypothetical protein IWW52_001256 [Coemansia sp. RSA 2704]KAJ2362544.1 hypothetical protein H4S01_004731 [Coemansia sp. RSA 2610]KAJ238924
MRFSAKLALAACVAAASAADTCTSKGEIKCGGDDSLLLQCDGSSWATSTCGSDQYCMTMNPGMIHCMLKPDNEDTASSKPTATSDSDSASEPTSDGSSSDDKLDTQSDTSAASALIARGAVAVALVAAGISLA